MPEDSGTNGFNVVYTAAPGEHPVLSGATRVSGWTLADAAKNLWSAPAPAGMADKVDLYVNGNPAARTRARLLAVFSKPAGGASAAAPGPKAHWKNPDDVIFEPQERGAIWSERTGAQESFVANAFELLGTPGEWYLDRMARRFYYTPRQGEDMTVADVEAAGAPGLIAGNGSAERPLAGIIFKGIRFEYTAQPRTPSRPKLVPRAAVRFAFAGAVQFLEDEFVHMGTPALELGPAVEGCTVDGCAFADIAWSAVGITGASAVRIEESRFSYVNTSPYEAVPFGNAGVVEVALSKDVSIERNQFDHYPVLAVLQDEGTQSAVREASNLVSPPMMVSHGAKNPAAPASGGDLGVPQAYSTLVGETFGAPILPNPPTGVSAEAEDGFAYVTWIPSCLDGGSPVESYTVASSSGAKATVSSDDFLAKGYIVFAALEKGRAVTFTVSAVSARGAGPPSLATAAVTPAHKRKLKPPLAPALVMFTTGTTGSSVRISPPSSDGGSPVIAYAIAAGPAGPPVLIEGLDVIRADADQPVQRTLDGFSVNGASEVLVSARNAAGIGKPLVVKLQK